MAEKGLWGGREPTPENSALERHHMMLRGELCDLSDRGYRDEDFFVSGSILMVKHWNLKTSEATDTERWLYDRWKETEAERDRLAEALGERDAPKGG